jgi:hypothetical protein
MKTMTCNIREKARYITLKLYYATHLIWSLTLRLVLLPSLKFAWKTYLFIAVTVCTYHIIGFILTSLHVFCVYGH